MLKILPLLSTQSLGLGDGGELVVQASYSFSTDPKDWVGQMISYDPETLREIRRLNLEVPALCGNGLLECGITSAFQLEDGRLMVISGRTSNLAFYQPAEGRLLLKGMTALTIRNRPVTVSEAKRVGDEYYLSHLY